MRVAVFASIFIHLESKIFAHCVVDVFIDNVCRFVALGSVDSLVSLWDLQELYCVRTFTVTRYS